MLFLEERPVQLRGLHWRTHCELHLTMAHAQGPDAEAGILKTKTPAQNICPYQEEQIWMLYHFDFWSIGYNFSPEEDPYQPWDSAKILGGLTTRPQVAPVAFSFNLPIEILGQIPVQYGLGPSYVQDDLQDRVLQLDHGGILAFCGCY